MPNQNEKGNGESNDFISTAKRLFGFGAPAGLLSDESSDDSETNDEDDDPDSDESDRSSISEALSFGVEMVTRSLSFGRFWCGRLDIP